MINGRLPLLGFIDYLKKICRTRRPIWLSCAAASCATFAVRVDSTRRRCSSTWPSCSRTPKCSWARASLRFGTKKLRHYICRNEMTRLFRSNRNSVCRARVAARLVSDRRGVLLVYGQLRAGARAARVAPRAHRAAAGALRRAAEPSAPGGRLSGSRLGPGRGTGRSTSTAQSRLA